MKTLTHFLLIILSAIPQIRAAEESIKVEATGILRTGLMAIGGETTGTTITAKGIAWELDLGKSKELRERAEKLNGKSATVRGSLERRRGVEIPQRWIVTVNSLNAAGAKNPPRIEATVKFDSKVSVVESGPLTRLDITSKRGIDTATIRRSSDKWPTALTVRLHLRGLESFKASAGKTTVEWSVSQEASRVSLRDQNHKEAPLKSDSPYFTRVKHVTGPTGYFEVPLPQKLFEGNPAEITLRWIDFYR